MYSFTAIDATRIPAASGLNDTGSGDTIFCTELDSSSNP